MASPPSSILLIEDDPRQAVLLRRAFAEVGWLPRVDVLKDGPSAIAALSGDGPFPSLIVLDPSGFEVLRWIRQESASRHVPVVVLTSSAAASDIQRAYELGADLYLVKPAAWNDLVDRVRSLQLFWTGLPVGASHV